MTHALIPALRKLKQAESEASLVYMESSRAVFQPICVLLVTSLASSEKSREGHRQREALPTPYLRQMGLEACGLPSLLSVPTRQAKPEAALTVSCHLVTQELRYVATTGVIH